MTSFPTLVNGQNPIMEVGEEIKLVNLKKNLSTSVANILRGADASQLKRSVKLEESAKIRLKRLEKDAESVRAKREELSKGWMLIKTKEKLPLEMKTTLKKQQQLCAAILQEKEQLIDDLRRDIKRRTELHEETLIKNQEEIGLLMERNQHQIDVLTRAYAQELKNTERVAEELERKQSDSNIRFDAELGVLKKKEETMETLLKSAMKKCEEKFEQEIKARGKEILNELRLLIEWQEEQRKTQRKYNKLAANCATVERIDQQLSIEAKLKKRLLSLRSEIIDLKIKLAEEDNDFSKKNRPLLKEHNRLRQRQERLQNQMKHFAQADVRQYEEVWTTIDSEVKLSAKKALEIDSLICSQFGSVYKPPAVFKDVWDPNWSQQMSPDHELLQTESASVALETIESRYPVTGQEGKAVHGKSSAELEKEKILKAVVETLFDEAGILNEDVLLEFVNFLNEQDKADIKLISLLHALGTEDKDLSKFILFIINYDSQQRNQAEDVCGSGTAEEAGKMGAELVDHNNILLALQSFLEDNRRPRSDPVPEQPRSQLLKGKEDKVYWESLGNVIPEDKLILWEEMAVTLKKYQAMLNETHDIISESEILEQQNAEMKKYLQQPQQHAQYPGAGMFDVRQTKRTVQCPGSAKHATKIIPNGKSIPQVKKTNMTEKTVPNREITSRLRKHVPVPTTLRKRENPSQSQNLLECLTVKPCAILPRPPKPSVHPTKCPAVARKQKR